MTDPNDFLKQVQDAILMQQLGEKLSECVKCVMSGQAHAVTMTNPNENQGISVFVVDEKGSEAISKVLRYLHKQEAPERAPYDN